MIAEFFKAFCSEMQDIKILLKGIQQTRVYGYDLYMQFPEPGAGSDTIPANTTTTIYDTTINRILKFMSFDVPDGVKVEIWKDNGLWADVSDSSGSQDFEGGVSFGVITIKVTNTTNYPLRWSLKFTWG